MVGHPYGWLAIRHHITCPLLALDDGTRQADACRLAECRSFTRAATTTEQTLLTALGHTMPTEPAELLTHVSGNPAVATRAWPDLPDLT